MTKNEAHEKFLRWIEAHPSDQWIIVGGDYPEHGKYLAGAHQLDGSWYKHFVVEYEEENDDHNRTTR